MGYGYVRGDAGSLSDTSFEFDSRTATVTRNSRRFSPVRRIQSRGRLRSGGSDQEFDQRGTVSHTASPCTCISATRSPRPRQRPPQDGTRRRLIGQSSRVDDPEQVRLERTVTPSQSQTVETDQQLRDRASLQLKEHLHFGHTDSWRPALSTDWERSGGRVLHLPVGPRRRTERNRHPERGRCMTYKPSTTDDIGKSIKVTASFTDDDGYSEQRSSSPVGPVTARDLCSPRPGGRSRRGMERVLTHGSNTISIDRWPDTWDTATFEATLDRCPIRPSSSIRARPLSLGTHGGFPQYVAFKVEVDFDPVDRTRSSINAERSPTLRVLAPAFLRHEALDLKQRPPPADKAKVNWRSINELTLNKFDWSAV